MTTTVTASEAETAALGRELGRRAAPGTTVLLEGELGAGKTAFVRGLADGLGLDPSDVSSPTFTLIQEYRGGRVTLQHVDLYRLSPAEVDELGLDDLLDDHTVMAIEWPDRLRRPPARPVRVRLAYDPGGRRVTIEE